MKPHKHAAIIKAWADGAEIEYRLYSSTKGWGDWQMLAQDKPFLSDSWWEYRIKPEPRPDVVKKYNVTLKDGWAFVDTNNQFYCPANLILFFDGVSGHLKSAEVI